MRGMSTTLQDGTAVEIRPIRADDKARMEHWLYTNDTNTALRAAIRLGGNEPAIVKARAAVNEKASNAKALIEGLPSSAHQDAGVLFDRR